MKFLPEDSEEPADLSKYRAMIAAPDGQTLKEAESLQTWSIGCPDGSIRSGYSGRPVSFINGYVKYGLNGQYGFVDAEKGITITRDLYEDARYFTDGYCPVKKQGKWGFIDPEGNEVTEFLFEDAAGLYDGKTYVKYQGKYGILDLKATLEAGIPVCADTLK